MAARRFSVTVVTAADGSATAYSPYFSGLIQTVGYRKIDYADGVDFTLTADKTGESIWAQADVNAAVVKAPRQPTHTQAGVASLYAAAGTAVGERIALAGDRVKIVLAQGGNVKSGIFDIVVVD